jgi:hypothetical protein
MFRLRLEYVPDLGGGLHIDFSRTGIIYVVSRRHTLSVTRQYSSIVRAAGGRSSNRTITNNEVATATILILSYLVLPFVSVSTHPRSACSDGSGLKRCQCQFYQHLPQEWGVLHRRRSHRNSPPSSAFSPAPLSSSRTVYLQFSLVIIIIIIIIIIDFEEPPIVGGARVPPSLQLGTMPDQNSNSKSSTNAASPLERQSSKTGSIVASKIVNFVMMVPLRS